MADSENTKPLTEEECIQMTARRRLKRLQQEIGVPGDFEVRWIPERADSDRPWYALATYFDPKPYRRR